MSMVAKFKSVKSAAFGAALIGFAHVANAAGTALPVAAMDNIEPTIAAIGTVVVGAGASIAVFRWAKKALGL
jgi:hypothetical protein